MERCRPDSSTPRKTPSGGQQRGSAAQSSAPHRPHLGARLSVLLHFAVFGFGVFLCFRLFVCLWGFFSLVLVLYLDPPLAILSLILKLSQVSTFMPLSLDSFLVEDSVLIQPSFCAHLGWAICSLQVHQLWT